MTAPAAVEHSAALDQLARALVRALESAAERTNAVDSAGSVRPLTGGDHPPQHEAAPSPASTRCGFAEDDRHEPSTDV